MATARQGWWGVAVMTSPLWRRDGEPQCDSSYHGKSSAGVITSPTDNESGDGDDMSDGRSTLTVHISLCSVDMIDVGGARAYVRTGSCC